jgi:hypothetical protein
MNRRSFFGTGAGVGAALLFSPLSTADAQTSTVSDLLVTQIEGAARDLQKAPSGEAARRMATALRVYAAYGRDRGIDKRIVAQLRKLRAADVMVNAVDELTLRGYTLPPGAAPVGSLADLERHRALIIRTGITPHFEQAAAGFERGSASLDRLRPVQAGGPGDCQWWAQLLLMVELDMLWICSPPIFALAPEMCPIASAQYAAVRIAMWWQGC